MLLSCCSQNTPSRVAAPDHILQCPVCGLAWQAHPPSAAELDAIYSKEYYASWGDGESPAYWGLKLRLALRILDKIETNAPHPKLLDVGCATGAGLTAAIQRGWEAHGIDVNPYAIEEVSRNVPEATATLASLDAMDSSSSQYDCVVLSDVLEHFRNPLRELNTIHRLLEPQGHIAILTPNISALSRRIMGRHWPHFKREHLFLFSPESLGSILEDCGFESVSMQPVAKPINLEYITTQFQSYPVPGLTRASRFLRRIMPDSFNKVIFPLHMGETLCIARKR